MYKRQVGAGTSLKLSGKYIVLYCVSASFLSTASNLDALYSNAVISKRFFSFSIIDIILNSLASCFVLPVANAALDNIQICSASGAVLNAEATVRVFPLFDTAEIVCVSVKAKGVHCTKTRLPLSSCKVRAASSVVILVKWSPRTKLLPPMVAVSCARIALYPT